MMMVDKIWGNEMSHSAKLSKQRKLRISTIYNRKDRLTVVKLALMIYKLFIPLNSWIK